MAEQTIECLPVAVGGALQQFIDLVRFVTHDRVHFTISALAPKSGQEKMLRIIFQETRAGATPLAG